MLRKAFRTVFCGMLRRNMFWTLLWAKDSATHLLNSASRSIYFSPIFSGRLAEHYFNLFYYYYYFFVVFSPPISVGLQDLVTLGYKRNHGLGRTTSQLSPEP